MSLLFRVFLECLTPNACCKTPRGRPSLTRKELKRATGLGSKCDFRPRTRALGLRAKITFAPAPLGRASIIVALPPSTVNPHTHRYHSSTAHPSQPWREMPL